MKFPKTVRGQAMLVVLVVLVIACYVGGTAFDLTACNVVLGVVVVLFLLWATGVVLYQFYRLLYALVRGRWL